MSVSIEQQIACVKRELAMRERVYVQWIAKGRMTLDKANGEMEALRAVRVTLEQVARSEGLFPT